MDRKGTEWGYRGELIWTVHERGQVIRLYKTRTGYDIVVKFSGGAYITVPAQIKYLDPDYWKHIGSIQIPAKRWRGER